jgi:hypothetical protein
MVKKGVGVPNEGNHFFVCACAGRLNFLGGPMASSIELRV